MTKVKLCGLSRESDIAAVNKLKPDLVGFVNGLPWVVIELKMPGVAARAAFDENLTHYKQQIPQLFGYNALLIASSGTESHHFHFHMAKRTTASRKLSISIAPVTAMP